MPSPSVELALWGYTVIPIIDDMEKFFDSPSSHPLYQMVRDSSGTFRQQYLDEVLSGNFASPLVGGSFGALANAESFHHPAIRQLRRLVDPFVVSLLREVPPNVQLGEHPLVYDCDEERLLLPRVMQLFDRVLIRPIGAKPTAESWHRDTTPLCGKNERVFGGWLNLNRKHFQSASLVPGSFMPQFFAKQRGFQTLPRHERDWCKANRVSVKIPPGHLLIFDETLIHEVVSKRQVEEPLLRLFFAWLRNTSPIPPQYHPLIKRNLVALQHQSVPPLKSDQLPPYYPKLYNVNWQDKRDELLTYLTPHSTPADNKFPCVLPPPPLLFPPYEVDDIAVLRFH